MTDSPDQAVDDTAADDLAASDGPTPDVAADAADAADVTDAAQPAPRAEPIDLGAIERDLQGVEASLGRLDDGSYWTDEVTGDAIPDDVLAADPVARRATGA